MLKTVCSRQGLFISLGLLAALVMAVLVPAEVDAHCRATDDPMIRDCSPVIGNFLPKLGDNSQRSVAGKMLSLVVSADESRLYAGAYSGVWRSDDKGKTWKQMTQPQPPQTTIKVPDALRVPNVFDLAASPQNKDWVLTATATAVPGFGDTFVPDSSKNGIYRSVDGGSSWRLVHQFKCPGSRGAQPVGQVVFAPGDARLVYAAGGCAIAISRDAGETWVDRPVGGTIHHVAVAPLDTNFIRRVYAAGPNQVWYSQDGGITWTKDKGPIPPSENCCGGSFDVVGNFPSEGFQSSSARILAVEPGHPDRVFLAVPSIMNGPSYYFGASFPDGTPCDPREPPGTGPGCGGGTLWLGDYSAFSRGQSARWRKLPGPPGYFGGSTPSGRVYVLVQPLPATLKTRPYLLFFGDTSHVHVSLGPPRVTADFGLTSGWHRLDGRDASQSKLDNDLSNKLFVHVDPHALAFSRDFNIRLKRAEGVDSPYNLNSVLDLDKPVVGTIWMANDGGVYRSFDGGRTWKLGDGLTTLAAAFPFAGVAARGKPPALYFGVPDNDSYFTLDGGATWKDPGSGCGDCGAWFADPAQTTRVIELNRGPSLTLHVSPSAAEYPDPTDAKHSHFRIPLPDDQGSVLGLAGYRPLILTTADDPLADGDYILVGTNGNGKRALLRTKKLSQITDAKDWKANTFDEGAKVFQQGPDFDATMANASLVQASGGHESPVFYVGDGASLWKCRRECLKGTSPWQRIVPAPDGSATKALRFFANPYDSREIYIIDETAIKRSVDRGWSWQVDTSLDSTVTEDGRFRYDVIRISGNSNSVINAVIRDMIFAPDAPTRFAVGNAGVFFSLSGGYWQRLLSTRALPAHPAAAYYDSISDPSRPALYVAFDGRGILRISPIQSR